MCICRLHSREDLSVVFVGSKGNKKTAVYSINKKTFKVEQSYKLLGLNHPTGTVHAYIHTYIHILYSHTYIYIHTYNRTSTLSDLHSLKYTYEVYMHTCIHQICIVNRN